MKARPKFKPGGVCILDLDTLPKENVHYLGGGLVRLRFKTRDEGWYLRNVLLAKVRRLTEFLSESEKSTSRRASTRNPIDNPRSLP